ncbi:MULTISPECIES: FecCD family ABC transporter permease [Rhodococcus]|uniref:Iron-siderophore ABC transporter permease protein n=3 Tax=Rhodococcus TaxID=1827 RepID=H0JT05_9NOCA|nr:MULTISPECIES: iron ABC transporter permease [Rhodococcus]EHK82918.1 iron-siderophore ABC transporter permease protein [Rhodococcus pyridinivorans AK37]MCD2143302.1 iron ABC transporter permease [Rhodococcus pyridinivorans]QXU51867.1 iron ABC transporter permease [Rhodococcus sp. LW-XY12]
MTVTPHAPPDADPTAPPRPGRRIAAVLCDLALLAIPLLIGALVVDTLADANGGGQTDRIVFGGAALAAAAGLLWWNHGYRAGRTGQSLGLQWTGLVLRDRATTGPAGTRRALLRRGTEIVTERHARHDEFTPRPTDGNVAALRRRRLLGLAALLVLLVLGALASIAVGARPMTFAEVFHALVVNDGSETDVIVHSLRIPRTLLALLVGTALGVAGALIQGHTRNPLADAGLLGINAGAAFLVVLSIYLFGLSTPAQYLWFAFAGSALASIVVFGFASIGNGGSSPLSLALAGAAVAFFLQAMIQTIVLLDQTSLDGYRFWVVGSVAGRGMDVFWQVLPFIVVGLLVALASTPALNLLSLGEDVARSLGTNVVTTRVIGIAAITVLTGAATAACGPIAFVGLIVPHIARAVTGPDYRWLVPYAGLLGGALLVLADVVGRIVVRPGELQVGIVLALIGAPFFIALVRRRKLVAL